jgi:hypothetical protein
MASKLEQYQKDFVKSVVQQERYQELLDNMIPAGKLDASQVLEVYHSDYFARLTEALGENFEAVWAVIGDEDFFALARSFIISHPSQKRDLNKFGHQLPEFLKSHELIEDYPFLAELADFEIGFWHTFHSAPSKGWNGFSQISQEQLLSGSFTFSPSLKVFSWDTRLYSIWQYREKGFDQCDEDFEGQQQVFIFKGQKSVEACELTEAQCSYLIGLTEGRTLMELIEEIEISPEEMQKLFEMISTLGIVESFQIP